MSSQSKTEQAEEAKHKDMLGSEDHEDETIQHDEDGVASDAKPEASAETTPKTTMPPSSSRAAETRIEAVEKGTVVTKQQDHANPVEDIMPMPIPQNNQTCQVPGAHAVGPAFAGDLHPRPQTVPTPPTTSPLVEPSTISLGGLAEATAVDEEQGGEIGQAHPVLQGAATDTPPSDERKREKRRHLLGWITVLALAFIAISVLVVVSVIKKSSKEDSTAASTNPVGEPEENATSIPPSSFLVHLPSYTVQVLESDMEGMSPQSKAYQWMLQDPNLENYAIDRQLQRFALAVFYHAMNGPEWDEQVPLLGNNRTTGGHNRELQFDPDGPRPYLFYRGFPLWGCRRRLQQHPTSAIPAANNSIPQTSAGFGQNDPVGPSGCKFGAGSPWLSYEEHECQWYNQHDPSKHDTCNQQGIYSNLYLSGHGLAGSLPKELALLTGMQRFFAQSNAITGTLPLELFSAWPQLKDFWVRNNHITGKLPNDIYRWQALERLNVFGNEINGALPEGVYNLPKLKMMAVVDNQFTGNIVGEELAGLSSLRILGGLDNSFQGSIPTQLGLISTLFSYTFEANDLTGSIPSQLGMLTHLEYFSVGKNDLSGSLPSELARMDLNLSLSVRENARLTGSIPQELGAKQIMNIYLQDTGITGTIPELWCNTSKTLRFSCSEVLCGCDCPCANK